MAFQTNTSKAARITGQSPATATDTDTAIDTDRRTGLGAAVLFVVGGLLMALGGAMHPRGSGSTVEAHLLSMFASPDWPLAHWTLLAGGVASFLAMASAWRGRTFGPRVQRWLPVVMVGWGFGALELVPHLLAAGEAHELEHHQATPVLDLHVVMQVVASPAVGLTGALLTILVARSSGSRVAWALAVFAVVGGVASAGAGPLTVLADDPRFTILFPFQAGLALWLIGTGVRLLRRSPHRTTEVPMDDRGRW